MRITVKGKNFDVPEHVRDEAIAKLSRVRRLFDRFIDMEVVFSEESNPRIEDRVHCEVVLHAKGKYLRAAAAAPDPLTAIDRVEAKLTRQVRKLKTRLVNRPRRQAVGPDLVGVASVTTEPFEDDEI
ncbi:ribosome hibernation-promoting factor, HPF/YfiA family [Egicoccus sp. AB-alg6-2]|uniref:ribosome hibernation-promoting factor, HPF/YfiA family n=1 Tax=Egicoccus sp. AB-alg6-2 TaxID=3242692 RepID=UPI00359DE2EC